MKTAILMICYNKSDILPICLSALNKSKKKELFDIYINDNGSTEDIEKIAKKYKAYYMKEKKNYFISRALNDLYFKYQMDKKYKYILIMANDVLVDPNTCIELVNKMESDPKIAVCGPVHYEWNTTIPRTMGLTIHKIKSTLVNYLDDKKGNNINHFHSQYMIRSDVFKKVGGFNNVLYPMIFEEPDIGERILKLGYYMQCAKKAKIWHPIEPVTTKKKNTKMEIRQDRLYSNLPKAYLFFRNRIIYMSTYSSWWQFLLFYVIFNPALFFYYLPTIKREHLKFALLGIVHGTLYAINKNQEYIKNKNKQILGI